MHKDYLKSNSIKVLKSYRDTKRMLHSSLRNAEIKYFGDQLELNSNDIFKFTISMQIDLFPTITGSKPTSFDLHTKKITLYDFHSSRIKSNSIGSIIIDSSKLIKVDYVKYLGVIIDRKLNWIEHKVLCP